MISRRMSILAGSWLTGYFVTKFTKSCISWIFGQDSSLYFSTSTLRAAPKISKLNDSSFTTHCTTSKPPNVLIYTGCKDRKTHFELVKSEIENVLNRDSYAIYQLDDQKVLGHPWSKNSILLVIYNNGVIGENILKEFQLYLKNGGNVLSVGCGAQNHSRGLVKNIELKQLRFEYTACMIEVDTDRLAFPDRLMEAYCGPLVFADIDYDTQQMDILASDKESGYPVILFSRDETSRKILSLVNLFSPTAINETNLTKQLLQAVLQKLEMKCISNERPQLTPAFLFASKEHKLELMKSLKPHLTNGWCKGKNISLLFCTDALELTTAATEQNLPIIIDNGHERDCNFDWNMYSVYLRTHTLGQIVLYTEVIPSTQTLLEGNYTFIQNVSNVAGIVAITSQQLKGKGRGGNAWLSPAGCMMFSIIVQMKFGTKLGSRLPYIQHVASLALVQAVKGMPGYEDIDICLKWPNDIYYGRTVKIGGVVISSTAMGNSLNAVIGMGVNVSNQEPTICINDIIKQYNHDNGTDLAPLQREMLLARTINSMEELIDDFQVNGKDSFLEKYYNHWMHGGSKVTLNTGATPEEVLITGLDDFGFLMVKKTSGETHSVQPDGNTFDIFANLIEIKT